MNKCHNQDLNLTDAPIDITLIEEILKLKKEKRVTILAHNYQSKENRFVADYVGDTLSLANQARVVDEDVILFCGPDFMVETAALLAGDRTVIYANEDARCPMASMISPEDIRLLKDANPGAKVVGYVNTSVESKCEMDICCTSSNAVNIINATRSEKVIFVPDKNLGANLQKFLPTKELILWPGFCSVHNLIEREDILELIHAHPDAEVLVHPECKPEVVEQAHVMLSTDGMIEYVQQSHSTEFIIGTEVELVSRMVENNPEKNFYPVPLAYCRTQKRIQLENILNALETFEPRVEISKEVSEKARRPLEKMMAFGRGDDVYVSNSL